MKLFLFLIVAIGVVLIYDAREIVTKYFSSNDKNKVISALKVVGFALAIISGLIICILK